MAPPRRSTLSSAAVLLVLTVAALILPTSSYPQSTHRLIHAKKERKKRRRRKHRLRAQNMNLENGTHILETKHASSPLNHAAMCAARGVYNADIKECRCTAGWAGHSCEIRDGRPCNSDPTLKRGKLNTLSICPGNCDDDRGMCYCSNLRYKQRPIPAQARFAVHSSSRLPDGRPAYPVRSPNGTWVMANVYFEADTQSRSYGWRDVEGWSMESLYGHIPGNPTSPGQRRHSPSTIPLCSPKVPSFANFPWVLPCPDARSGKLCEDPKLSFCLRNCSGHGWCDSGFCWCDEGWFGIDCSRGVQGNLADSLQSTQHIPSPSSTSKLRIYVYDMPSEFTTRNLQWMGSPGWLARLINNRNESHFGKGSLYSMEILLHEWLLDSSLRTNIAEEAHLFYVPIYLSSLFISSVSGFAGLPYYGSETNEPRTRSHQGTLLMLRALQYIRSEYPWWNMSRGTNHVWLMLHDEGPCFCPLEIRSSILLTHYGYYASSPQAWGTYDDDNFLRFKGFYENYIGTRSHRPRCFKRGKDLVIPPWKHSSFWGPAFRKTSQQLLVPREGLVYFAGDLGFNRISGYSHDLRQLAFALFCDPNKTIKKACTPVAYDRKCDCECRYDMPQNCSLWKPGVNLKVHTNEYSKELMSHTFCLAFPGDGWSSRVLDAVIHGCIPVIVQDDAEMFFEGAFTDAGLGLDYANFSIRIPEAELPSLLDVLGNISQDRVMDLRKAALSVRDYFIYKDMYNPSAESRRNLLETGMAFKDAFWLLIRALEARATPELRARKATDL